jgi:tripartite-type tricarboxylate transporter receptor subunit TctC
MNRRDLLLGTASTVLSLATVPGFAEDVYPSRRVRILVGFAAGGPTDIVARHVANKLSIIFNQRFLVENKGGASGTLAALDVTRAKPDGYTLLINASTSHTFYPLIARKPAYDPINDFSSISLVGVAPTVIAINPNLNAKTLREFVALLKANPGKYSFGSSGMGSMSHLTGELFKQQAGVDIIHVPYKGAAPGLQDVVSGQIAMLIDTFSTELPLHKQGLIRILAVCDTHRSEVDPEIPTTTEELLPGVIAGTYNELLGPPNMPKSIIDKLAHVVGELRNDKEFLKSMFNLSVEVRLAGPEETRTFTQQQLERWRPVVQSIGLKLDY